MKKKNVQKAIIIKPSNSKICRKNPLNVNSSKVHWYVGWDNSG